MPEILERLRRAQKRLTPQRHRLLAVLLDSDEHLDVEEIRRRASHDEDRVSSATVYRTMRMLVDQGIIKERHFRDGSARYEYVREGEHHDHLICNDCGDVVEFTNETIERLQEVVAAGHGFRMTAHKHEVYGVCRKCQRRARAAKKSR